MMRDRASSSRGEEQISRRERTRSVGSIQATQTTLRFRCGFLRFLRRLPSPSPASAAALRKVSRCALITWCSTVCSASRGRSRGTTQPMPRRSASAQSCPCPKMNHGLSALTTLVPRVPMSGSQGAVASRASVFRRFRPSGGPIRAGPGRPPSSVRNQAAFEQTLSEAMRTKKGALQVLELLAKLTASSARVRTRRLR